MQLTFEPEWPQPAASEKIIVGGKVIGTVKPHGGEVNKYQAQLHLAKHPRLSGYYPSGFGPTRESAIVESLNNAEEQATMILSDIAAIRAGE